MIIMARTNHIMNFNDLINGTGIGRKGNSQRGTVYSADKDTILQRQKGLCAGKNCSKLHNGKKMPVNIRNNFDHIKPLALGGKDILSNIQALCANCHQLKTREDRKKIALANKEKAKQSVDFF